MSSLQKFSSLIFLTTFLVFFTSANAASVANNQLIKGSLTGNIKLVKKALKNGADINVKEQTKGNTALMLAAYYKHHNIVSLLIQSKANVHERDFEKNTALMKASWTGGLNSATLLLKAGTDINAKEINGMTALMIASFYGQFDIVKLLVQKGCDFSAKDNDGYTAIMNAQNQKHEDIVAYLKRLTQNRH